jgi:hypothetical protein
MQKTLFPLPPQQWLLHGLFNFLYLQVENREQSFLHWQLVNYHPPGTYNSPTSARVILISLSMAWYLISIPWAV